MKKRKEKTFLMAGAGVAARWQRTMVLPWMKSNLQSVVVQSHRTHVVKRNKSFTPSKGGKAEPEPISWSCALSWRGTVKS